MSEKGKLILIPHPLSDYKEEMVNEQIKGTVKHLNYFIVEQVKTARRYLKAIDKTIDIDKITFFELNKKTNKSEIESFLAPIKKGHNIGLMSEAGCPGVADPGNVIARRAHMNDIVVTPLIGPNSIIMALMSSGLNGQQFTFHGYLARDGYTLKNQISNIESTALKTGYTQIFMDTPYRNVKLFDAVVKYCKPETMLCIAANITGKNEWIKTQSISNWKKQKPDIHKQPAMFLLGR